MSTRRRSLDRDRDLLGPPPAAGGPGAPTGSVFTFKPAAFPVDPDEARHATRRLRKSANELSRPDRLLVLDCQGRGCRRQLGQVLTRPPGSGVTPDGTIQATEFTEGPVLEVWGPFESDPKSGDSEFVLRGRKASIAIICGCGYRHVVSLSALSGQVELVRGALDPPNRIW